jgi:hypothetical protein
MLLGIMAKPLRRDKFEVTPDSVAYLTGNDELHLKDGTFYLIFF